MRLDKITKGMSPGGKGGGRAGRHQHLKIMNSGRLQHLEDRQKSAGITVRAERQQHRQTHKGAKQLSKQCGPKDVPGPSGRWMNTEKWHWTSHDIYRWPR